MRSERRPPVVAGQFYDDDAAGLARQVERCFQNPRGPGQLPSRHRSADRRIRAAIVPHAGLVYSGPIAARAFYELAGERSPRSVLILGVDHHGGGRPFALSDRDWETPLGPVAVDHDLVRALAQPPVEVDERAHELEHSIEVELPFLQYVEPKLSIAALMVRFAPFDVLQKVARVVRQAIDGRDVLLIASTDFSHYVSVDAARHLDQLATDQILKLDGRGLYRTVVEHDISMCGIAPTTVLLEALAGEPLSARLLKWGHSGEEEPMREVVGYASLLLESSRPLGASAR
jgi:AmmeMemoRadiSam system protein B